MRLRSKVVLAGIALGAATASWAFTHLTDPPKKWGAFPMPSPSGEIVWKMNEAGTADYAGGPPTGDGEVLLMKSALLKWDTATEGALDLEYGGSTTAGVEWGDGENVVAWLDPWPGPAGAAGIGGAISVSGSIYIEGMVELNGERTWTSATYIEAVILHELGHGFGLGHSTDKTAVMWTTYHGELDLQPDDVAGIRAIYGVGLGTDGVDGAAPPPPPPPDPVPAPDPAGGTGVNDNGADLAGEGHGGARGHCYVATASWGRGSQPVNDLVAWRADWLYPSAVGRVFDRLYCGVGPPAADRIDVSRLQPAGRAVLAPLAFAAQGGAFTGLAGCALAVLLGITALRRMR